jgi:hypothetical protein
MVLLLIFTEKELLFMVRKCFPNIEQIKKANSKQLKLWSITLPNSQTEDEDLIVKSIKERLKKK